MNGIRLIFLAGLIPNSQRWFINENSIGAIQHAADSLQQGFIEGLSKHLTESVVVLNFPFVGSYPKRFSKLNYPPSIDRLDGIEIRTIGFLNFTVLKQVSRLILSIKNLYKFTPENGWIIVYSAHPPFVLAAVLFRMLRRSVRLCLILPDLPDYMGAEKGFQGVLNKLARKLFYKIIHFFDCYVFLTLQMADRINVDHRKSIIIEGIAQTIGVDSHLSVHKSDIRAILYTGTLAEKYGVKNLVDAFSQIKIKNVNLWICGEGDARSYIQSAAVNDSRIKFLGQVDRLQSIQLQRSASILVNPRLPADEYTKYSFPSKIMEYMVSGRPVVMYRLEGIPDEYFQYSFVPDDLSVKGLAGCIETVLQMSDDELKYFGEKAREFVLGEKNSGAQALKLINLMRSLSKDNGE